MAAAAATPVSNAGWTPPEPGTIPAPARRAPEDIHTHANLIEIRPTHLDLEWTIDWDKRIFSGSVEHTLVVEQDGVDRCVMDSSFLDIHKVTVNGEDAKWELSKRKNTLGSALTMQIGRRNQGDKIKVLIDYSTTEQCTALGWLTTEQTESKKTPFLYSQAQAIHARSMLPCMDSPSRKITYTAKVHSKIPVLMSALAEGTVQASPTEPGEARVGNADTNGLSTYHFRQPVSVPTYLIAIVGGTLSFRSLAPRVGVWAEPTMIDRAEWEFKEDANRFLIAAEDTISPYSWSRYDCVVLPPSFPYGGMENANLTTLTPSLIAGDRSQTDVLLHELAHSWSGNLTSCGNWASFWLNEGINVWIERLLLQVVHGPEEGPAQRGFSYIIGAKALTDALEQFKDIPRFQRLVPVFKEGEDPDDCFSSIPYEKGSNFILHLEQTVGGLDVFLPFIRSHFRTFYDRSVTTEEWKQHLFDFYKGSPEITKKLEAVDWDGWLHGEGLELPVKMQYDDRLALQAFKLAERWIKVIEGKRDISSEKFKPKDIEGWDSNQVVVFLERLHAGPRITSEIIESLDSTYKISSNTNTEILVRFYEVALEDPKGKYAKEAAQWVTKQGRMKYCRAIYRALFAVEPELAKKTFTENKTFYHPIAAAMIEKDLQLSSSRPQLGDKGPLIAVCGCTGTGKTKLGVELGHLLSGRAEVISADSMQIYQGLDVITNKASSEEMEGVKHHLMSFRHPCPPTRGDEYVVKNFVEDANALIEEMDKEGKTPIVVGGTTYYIQHLFLPGRLVSLANGDEEGKETKSGGEEDIDPILHNYGLTARLDEAQIRLLHRLAKEEGASFQSLGVTALQLWKTLEMVDPTMAQRWHIKDTRKVMRSIRILLETGKRQSEWIKEQDRVEEEQHRCDGGGADRQQRDKVIFWLWCDPTVLKERLNNRIEKMIDQGLLKEIVELRTLEATTVSPDKRDFERGIFQTIGYKEFDAYLTHCQRTGTLTSHDSRSLRPSCDDEQGGTLFAKAVEDMKTATRQYARSQTHWIRNKLIPEIRKERSRGARVYLYRLDATDLDKWNESVGKRAKEIVQGFVNRYSPTCDDYIAQIDSQELGGSSHQAGGVDQIGRNRFEICDLCTQYTWHQLEEQDRKEGREENQTPPEGEEEGSEGIESNSEIEREPYLVRQADWQAHLKSRAHRAALRWKQGPRNNPDEGPEAVEKRRRRRDAAAAAAAAAIAATVAE